MPNKIIADDNVFLLKCQALFSLKNNEKKNRNVICSVAGVTDDLCVNLITSFS